MKIEFTEEKPLAEIELGECFKWASNIYMKCFLEERMYEQLGKDEELFNRGKHSVVLDLEYGDISLMESATMVNPLNMKVVVR